MICPKCGKDAGEAKFCPECGEPLSKVQGITNDVVADLAQSEEHKDAASLLPNTDQTPASSTASEDYYTAMQRVEKEKAKKRKTKRLGCLGAVVVVFLLMLLIGIVRGAQLTPDEKQQTQEVIAAIETLPKEIALSDEDAIDTVMQKYTSLNEKQQKKVKNRKVLIKADEIIDKLKVEKVENAIQAIGTVTEESGDVIQNAFTLYDAMPEELQQRVSFGILEKAKADYEVFCVESVKKQIDSIGTVTLDSKELLDAIAEEYDILSEDNQAMVTNYDTYTAAVEQYQKLFAEMERKEEAARKSAFTAAVKGMRHEVDEISDYTWYYPKSFPQHINTRTYFLPYLSVSKETGEVWMRLKVDYFADDWIFWTDLTISVDGAKHEKNFSYHDVKRDAHYGDIWEYVDIECNADDILLLRAIANSQKTLIRFRGDKYRKDFTISEADKASIRSILDAYDAYYGN